MPFAPSEAFLLWHETQATGRWRDLLRQEATVDVLMALWLMQTVTLAPPRGEDAMERAAAAIASGWGQ